MERIYSSVVCSLVILLCKDAEIGVYLAKDEMLIEFQRLFCYFEYYLHLSVPNFWTQDKGHIFSSNDYPKNKGCMQKYDTIIKTR
jgi:hypothetical protein